MEHSQHVASGEAQGFSDSSPLHLLHRVGQIVDTQFVVGMSDLDITPRQFAILAAVSVEEGSSQAELTARTGIDRSTMADVVRRLHEKGLLHRRRTKDDARAYAVTLSARGHLTVRAAQTIASRVERELLSLLPKGQAEKFVTSLNTIVGAYAKGDDETS